MFFTLITKYFIIHRKDLRSHLPHLFGWVIISLLQNLVRGTVLVSFCCVSPSVCPLIYIVLDLNPFTNWKKFLQTFLRCSLQQSDVTGHGHAWRSKISLLFNYQGHWVGYDSFGNSSSFDCFRCLRFTCDFYVFIEIIIMYTCWRHFLFVTVILFITRTLSGLSVLFLVIIVTGFSFIHVTGCSSCFLTDHFCLAKYLFML